MLIPKLYNGRNKTFFFFNVELYRETQLFDTTPQTVPTNGMRAGDFSALLTPSKTLGTDPLGRLILQNTIYDPTTARSVNGQIVTDPFPGNIIPQARMDRVALKIQALIPTATLPGFVNNIVPAFPSNTSTTTPAYKVDQYMGSKSKISFYISSIGNTRQYSPERATPMVFRCPSRGPAGTSSGAGRRASTTSTRSRPRCCSTWALAISISTSRINRRC